MSRVRVTTDECLTNAMTMKHFVFVMLPRELNTQKHKEAVGRVQKGGVILSPR